MNQRILETIPANYQGFFLDKTTWVTDTQFMAMPKGLDKDRLAVTIELMKWLMTPAQQAVTYDNGYFYPGPAIKGVTLDMAPAESQKAITAGDAGSLRGCDGEAAEHAQLDSKPLVEAMDMWDQLVGAKIKK